MPDTDSRSASLETSRLVIELIHASYATRRSEVMPRMRADTKPAAGSAAAAGSSGIEPVTMPPLSAGANGRPISNHAIRAMIHLHQHGERTIGQLAAGLGISFGWASRVVDELDANGTVTRERDTRDRRVVRVTLTPQAIAQAERVYDWRRGIIEAALAGLNETEHAAVNTFLRRATDGLLVEAGAFEKRPPGTTGTTGLAAHPQNAEQPDDAARSPAEGDADRAASQRSSSRPTAPTPARRRSSTQRTSRATSTPPCSS